MGLTVLHRIAFLGLKEVCRILLLSEGIHHFVKAEVGDIKVVNICEFNSMKFFRSLTNYLPCIQRSEMGLNGYFVSKRMKTLSNKFT